MSRPPGGEENLLDDLLGVSKIADDAVREADRLAMMGIVERLQLRKLRAGRLGGAHNCTVTAMTG
jgi:hypothetical protein